MRQRLTSLVPFASGSLLVVALSCGGQATTNGAGSGGASMNGESGGSSMDTGTGGAGDDVCESLASEARDRFYADLWKDHRNCETDDDCMQFSGHHNCISNCFILSNTDTDGIEDALDEACVPFDERGCEARLLPCLVHTVACNESGICIATWD